MNQCLICKQEFNTMRGLSNHIKIVHNLTSSQYYVQFFGQGYCEICGKPTNFHNLTLGFYKRCSRGCANKTETHKLAVKNTKLEKYGNATYNNPQKISEVLSKRTQNDINKSTEKSKQTRLIRYNNATYNNQQKRMNTLLKNNIIRLSKSEQYCYTQLLTVFNEVKIQYWDERYPFFCDFYIPEQDLFIETHFTWLHGSHRYNKKKDKTTLELWQNKAKTSDYYKKAIYIWTINDELKYKTAKANKLNYKTFYSQKEFDLWLTSL